MKIDTVKVVKITGTVMGIAGTLLTSWASKQETNKILETLVNQKFASKQ